MFKEIPEYNTWSKIEKIDKGWSSDIKYYIETNKKQKRLLRISSIEEFNEKKKEYDIIAKYASLGFEMSKPIDFGICNKNRNTYMLLTWVEGEDLRDALPQLNKDDQYRLGTQAGNILKLIHSLDVEIYDLPIKSCLYKKKNQLSDYINSNIRMSNDNIAIEFINKNFDKINLNKQTYLHGDFHPGNLILTPNKKIGVIDFNRWDVGDPYEEFYKLESFGVEVSIPYSVGQINAYFNNNAPSDFWDIHAVYVAHSSLYSIKWSQKYDIEGIENMKTRCKNAFKNYDYFKNSVPTWYEQFNESLSLV